jgi:hypothetical protein
MRGQWQRSQMRLMPPGGRASFPPLKNEQQPSSSDLANFQQRQSRMTRDGRRLPPREYSHASGLAASIALKKNLMATLRISLTYTSKERTMKFTTIALAIAFTVPSTFALARGGHGGGMHIGSSVSRPFASPVGTGRIANRPRNITGNTLAPIAHDPSGSTISGSAMNRTGG